MVEPCRAESDNPYPSSGEFADRVAPQVIIYKGANGVAAFGKRRCFRRQTHFEEFKVMHAFVGCRQIAFVIALRTEHRGFHRSLSSIRDPPAAKLAWGSSGMLPKFRRRRKAGSTLDYDWDCITE